MARFPVLGGLAILCSACGPYDSRLLSMHTEENRAAKARHRWDAVRGTVKLQLAEEHLKAGRIPEAEKALEESLAMCPDDANVYLLATRLRLDQGRLAEAREAVTVAASLSTHEPEVPYLAGVVDQRYGDLETAFEHYSHAAALAPNVADYLQAQAEVLIALDRPIDALELVQPRLRDFDQNVALRMLASRISRILGLRGPAVDYCREAARIAEKDEAISTQLGLLLTWAEQYEEAKSVLRPIVETRFPAELPRNSPTETESHTRSPSIVFGLARAYIETSQPEDARQLLRRLTPQERTAPLPCLLYARASIMLSDFQGAAAALEASHRRNPPTTESLVMAAFAALHLADYDGVRSAVDGVLELDADFAPAHCLRGQAAEAEGHWDEARASYEQALAVDPGSWTARSRLDAIMDARRAEDLFDDSLQGESVGDDQQRDSTNVSEEEER